jgi:hypothetical protein
MTKMILKYVCCFTLALLFFTGCKKDDKYEPVQQNSVGVYYWFTYYNSTSTTYWLRSKANSVWTWYSETFKVFGEDNRLSKSFSEPLDDFYEPGYYGNAYLAGSSILNENGNLENICLYYNDDGPDPAFYNIHLRVVEMDAQGYTNVKSVPMHYHSTYYDYINAARFIKTGSNYYIMYAFTCLDTSEVNGYPAFKDSLLFVKTDLDLNVISKVQTTASDTLMGGYHIIYDIQESPSKVYVSRTDLPEYSYSYGSSMIEIYDKDLNLENKISLEDVYPGASQWYTSSRVFQKIMFVNNRLIAFGEKQEYYTSHNTLLMSIFDPDGNLLNSVNIATKKPSAFLKGVEACPDGKFLLYYSESDESGGSTTSVGVCKVDANGNQEYSLLFPENDPNNYTPCMAYENTDGTVTIYAVKKGQQSPEQTIAVRMDRNGKIK